MRGSAKADHRPAPPAQAGGSARYDAATRCAQVPLLVQQIVAQQEEIELVTAANCVGCSRAQPRAATRKRTHACVCDRARICGVQVHFRPHPHH